ncbi:hypothetical protein L1D19_05025 [Vibrio natriegens]|uniref:hypothetical protein n=1 Tax=Vibrio natriegens TaxID=691 RepID=UPI001EFE076D|nr:hypothetical protein [Vibrio natriegens]MCG9699493.1 hypothetical protein [Vibrio natriegens]
MEHSNKLTPISILIMTMPFTSFVVGAATPSHHEAQLNSSQLKIEIAASQQRAALEIEQSTQALKQHMESYIRSETIWLERYHARQIEMSEDIKELLKRKGL